MKKFLTKIKDFLKEDWKKTRGWKLWNIVFSAWMMAIILNSFIHLLYTGDTHYYSLIIWQIGYLLMWTLLMSAQDLSRKWRALCNDIQDFNHELVEDNQKLTETLNKIFKLAEEQENEHKK